MSSTTSHPRFSEALWFKHGEQEEAAAQAPDTEAPGHTLPVEDRYTDERALTREEIARYSLRTGATSKLASLREAPRYGQISDRELLAPVLGAPLWPFVLAMIAVLAIVAGVVL